MGMADFTTVDAIKDLTGVEVGLTDLKIGQAIVMLFAGTTTAASDAGLISSRNLRHLAWAVAWQTVWMDEHPDVFTNVDSSSFSQDGVSSSQAHANAHLLAPLAKRCIDRLSWNLQPLRAYRPRRLYTDPGNRNSAAHDDGVPWIPLP